MADDPIGAALDVLNVEYERVRECMRSEESVGYRCKFIGELAELVERFDPETLECALAPIKREAGREK